MKNPESIIRGIMHESVMSAVKKHVGTTDPNEVAKHFKHDKKAAKKIIELAASMEEALDPHVLRAAVAGKPEPSSPPTSGLPSAEIKKTPIEVVKKGIGKKTTGAIPRSRNTPQLDLNLLRARVQAEKGMTEEVEQLDEKSAAWQRKEGKNPEGGLNKKGVESYRRENPGSKLQTAVTTEPSKLKPGSKKAKRRLSFCRRMKGMKKKLTSAKTARDPNSRINKSLRKWNCE